MGLGIIGAAALLLAVCAGASAAPIPARNGQIHACYKARGKAKGAMRVVAGKHCRRGERKLTWSVVGPPGASGATGSQGSQGASGSQGNTGVAGTAGSAGSGGGATVASLETKVASLNLEVDALKKLLGEVTPKVASVESVVDGLGGTVGTLGTTVTGLSSKTDSLCTEVAKVPGQIDAVGDVLNNLLGGLKGIPLVGNILAGEEAPETPSFTCPSS